MSQVERDKLHAIIKQRFELDDGDTEELVVEATEVEQQAIDLYHFTARLNRSLDETGRARMVEMMWQIIYADGVVTEFEDNLVWRAADLLRHFAQTNASRCVNESPARRRQRAMSALRPGHRDHRSLGRHRR